VRLVLVIPPRDTSASEQRIPLHAEGVDIGGAADCDAVIDHPSVGTARVRIERRGEHWVVIDREGRGMCSVGGVPLHPREPRIVRPPHQLRLGDVDLELAFDVMPSDSQSGSTREVALRATGFVAEVAPAQPRVRVVEGPHMGEVLELAHAGPFRVGRAKSCALFLESDDASREHFAIERQAHRIVVKDLGSARGTFLGRSRLEAHRAAVWDATRMVRAADAVFALEVGDGAVVERLLAPLGKIQDATPVVDAPPAAGGELVEAAPMAEPAAVVEVVSAMPAEVVEVVSAIDTQSRKPAREEDDRPRARSSAMLLVVVFAGVIGVVALAALIALVVW
jgi:hypothetical protein